MKSRWFWIGLALGCGVMLVALEGPYVDWQRVMAPIDQHPLMIRHDAKGDGRFSAPRSGRRRHRGIDVAATLESPVRAIRSGVVVQVGAHRGLGRFVELEHRHQVRSLYAHLQTVQVEPGARVKQGTVIGTVGKTGNARHPWIVPHLHLEIAKAGVLIDPQTLGLLIFDQTPDGIQRAAPAASGLKGASDARGGESLPQKQRPMFRLFSHVRRFGPLTE